MAARRPRQSRQLADEAEPEEVADFARGLRKTHLLCRELGHNWLPHTVRIADGGGYDRVLRCSRCRTERWQLLTSFGGIVSNHYKYPDGYTNHGHGRIVGEGRDILRLESITRLMGEAHG